MHGYPFVIFMVMISLILAIDESNLIGKGLRLPWHIQEDLLYYKEKVKDKEILVGHNTFKSFKYYHKNEVLPYVRIFLATRQQGFDVDPNVHIVNDAEAFLKLDHDDLFVVGGAQIYRIAIHYADYVYLSRIKGIHQGDVYIHDLNLHDFTLVSERETALVIYQVYRRSEVRRL